MQKLVPQMVQRAAELLGGVDRVADYLGVDEHKVRFWLQRRALPGNAVMAKLMDLILQDDIARARQDRRHAPRGDDGTPLPADEGLDS